MSSFIHRENKVSWVDKIYDGDLSHLWDNITLFVVSSLILGTHT